MLITGGSRGIGAACAVLAAADGWAVGVNYNASSQAANAVVAQIMSAGGRAVALRGDVSQERDVVAMFDACEAAFGPITGVINNAGILDQASSFADISQARWERILAVNATGSFLVAREVVRRMVKRGQGGAIVNMSSMAAPLGAAHEFVDYAASKGAVEAMTIGLSKEVACKGIRVNAIRPGLIETEMQAQTGDPDRARRLVGSVSMGRLGQAHEVAAAALWFLSEGASYITGAIVPVSGGR